MFGGELVGSSCWVSLQLGGFTVATGYTVAAGSRPLGLLVTSACCWLQVPVAGLQLQGLFSRQLRTAKGHFTHETGSP